MSLSQLRRVSEFANFAMLTRSLWLRHGIEKSPSRTGLEAKQNVRHFASARRQHRFSNDFPRDAARSKKKPMRDPVQGTKGRARALALEPGRQVTMELD